MQQYNVTTVFMYLIYYNLVLKKNVKGIYIIVYIFIYIPTKRWSPANPSWLGDLEKFCFSFEFGEHLF